MLDAGGGVQLVRPHGNDFSATGRTRNNTAQFHAALDRAQTTGAPTRPVSQPPRSPSPPTTPEQQPPQQDRPRTFGPDEPEAGIETYRVEQCGRVPFQVYRASSFGYQSNDELHAQLSATPGLDPKPFGNRPGAPANADRRLQDGDEIIVLDEVRLGFLEEQRALLGNVLPSASTDSQVTRQQEQIDELTASVSNEIDYATQGQAVPNFEEVASTIRARAPNDPIFQRAVDQAKRNLEANWRAQGRTQDQIGEVLAAGEAGAFNQVSTLTRQQMITVAEEEAKRLGPDATDEQIEAAINTRLAVYQTYVTGDPRYLTAVQQGADAAKQEIFVTRPIQQVVDAGRPEGMAGAMAAMAKLREITDRSKHSPHYVQAIVSDPQIAAAMRRGFSWATTWVDVENPEPGTEGLLEELDDRYQAFGNTGDQIQLMRDLAAVSQNAVYSDGRTPGRGTQAINDLAAYANRVASHDVSGRYDYDRNSWIEGTESFAQLMDAAAEDGNIALPLAIDAIAVDPDRRNSALAEYTMQGVNTGIVKFNQNLEQLLAEATDHASRLKVPLDSWGGTLSEQEKTAMLEQMLDDNPALRRQLEEDGRKIVAAQEQLESINLVVDHYRDRLAGTIGFDVNVAVTLNGVAEGKNLAEQVQAIPMPNPVIEPTNTLWFARGLRALGTFTVVETLRATLPKNSRVANILVDRQAGIGALPRLSAGFSAMLFWENGRFAGTSSEFQDQLYQFHYAMAVQQAYSAVTPPKLMQQLWGTNPAGNANTPIQRAYDLASARIDRMHVSDGMKTALRGMANGVLRDAFDVGYVVIDGYNAVHYARAGDWWRTAAYTISVASDIAFATGAGALVGSGAVATGIGAALMVIASGINYGKGRYDHAHKYDEDDERFLELLGVRDEIAQPLAEHKSIRFDADAPFDDFPLYYPDQEAYASAGPFLMAAFDRAGYSTAEAVAIMNSWTPEQADQLADYIKHETNLQPDQTGNESHYFDQVATYAQEHGIPYPVA